MTFDQQPLGYYCPFSRQPTLYSPLAATHRISEIANALNIPTHAVEIPIVSTMLYECALAVGEILRDDPDSTVEQALSSQNVSSSVTAIFDAIDAAKQYHCNNL